MISKSALGTIAKDQLKEFDALGSTVPRSVLPALIAYTGASAMIVKGLRRCGKSTLLKQMFKSRYSGDFAYFNFDDDRLAGFKAEDFQSLLEVSMELFGQKKNLFFDEIQNVTGWELFVNRLLREGYRVFITGSNANLLSKALGTHLTGRHVDIELYPFSFSEFLAAKCSRSFGKFYSTEERVLLSKSFAEYFEQGGMPEVVMSGNNQILASVLNDLVQKDIVARYNVRKPNELKSVLNFLIANAANPITYRSIQNNFGIKSANTIQKYIEYIKETYLIFTVRKFDKKIKQFDKNPQKVYCVDNGLIMKNTPAFHEMRGAMLENLIAVHLKRLGREFYYYKGKSGAEADFVVPAEKTVIQSCYELTGENSEREFKGLLEAMNRIQAKDGLILTFDQTKEVTRDNKKITVKPAWLWLLENERSSVKSSELS